MEYTNSKQFVKSKSSEKFSLVSVSSEFKCDDDEPPSIRGFSLTFLGFFLAFLTIFFPLIIVLLGRPTSQINEMTINQSIKKDGS